MVIVRPYTIGAHGSLLSVAGFHIFRWLNEWYLANVIHELFPY